VLVAEAGGRNEGRNAARRLAAARHALMSIVSLT